MSSASRGDFTFDVRLSIEDVTADQRDEFIARVRLGDAGPIKVRLADGRLYEAVVVE